MAKTKFQFYFLAAGIAFLGCSIALTHRYVTQEPDTTQYNGYLISLVWILISGFPIVTTLLLGLVCLHIFTVQSSKHYTSVTGVILVYVFNQAMRFSSIFITRKLDKYTKDPRGAQEELLKDMMENNAETIYGRKYKFNTIKQLEDLRDKHPLTEYSHYEKYVERMANGEENILISEPLLRFGITSGTTGKGKLIPITNSRFNIVLANNSVNVEKAYRKWGRASPLQKAMMFYVNPKPTQTKSGHTVGPMHLFTDDMKFMAHVCTTPWAGFSISTDFEAAYLVLLFGIRDPTAGFLLGAFSFTIHKAMTLLETNWKRLVHDIKTGTIDQDLQIPADVREECEKAMSPDVQRAEDLRREFERGFDGIMRRIWPDMKFLVGIETSDFTEKLQNGYARGIPIYSTTYASTEGDYGINLWPGERSRYVLLPHSVIFEFIPEEHMNDDNPKTLFLDEVKKGERYEMVVSTLSGFLRYRFGDVIEVVDFHHKTPVIDFLYRSGQLLNLRAEKVTEISVDESVHILVDKIQGAKLANWTSAESTLLSKVADDISAKFDTGGMFYFIFVELEGQPKHSALDDEQQHQFDNALKERNNYYRGYRNAGTISPPRVYLVKPGTIKALQDYIVAHSTASYNQFKVPRKLKTAGTLKLMLESIASME